MTKLDIFALPEDGRVFIQASAGTGKTRVLCDLVIKALATAQVSVDQVVMISFTNASVKDLNVRLKLRLEEVLDALKQNQTDDDYVVGLIKYAQVSAPVLFKKLYQAWWNIHLLKITTVHAMCLSFIQQKPELFGLQPGAVHQVIDGSLSATIINKFWRNLDSYFTVKVAEHIYSYTKLADYRLNDIQINNLQMLHNHQEVKHLTLEFTQFMVEYEGFSQEVRKQLSACDLDIYDIKTKSGLANLEAMRKWLTDAKQFEPVNTGWLNFLLDNKLGIKLLESVDVYADSPLVEALQQLRRLEQQRRSKLQTLVRTAFRQEKIDKLLQSAFTNNHIDFSSMLLAVGNSLMDAQQQAVIKNEIGQQFKMVLVDEYQDLQPVQTEIIQRMFAHCLQICVFDLKQSIYSFQGADIYHLETERQALLAENRVFNLSSSWRFAHNNQADINRVFAAQEFLDTQSILANDIALSYDAIECASGDKFNLLLQSDQETLPCAGIEYSHGPENVYDIVRQARNIADLIAANKLQYTIDNKQQPLRLNDIAILVRTNAQLTKVAGLLKANKIAVSYRSTDSVWISDEVMLLSNILLLILQNNNINLLNWAVVTGGLSLIVPGNQSDRSPASELEHLQVWLQNQQKTWSELGMGAVVINCLPLVLNQVSSSEYVDAYSNLNQILELVTQHTNRSNATDNGMLLDRDWQWFTDQLAKHNSSGAFSFTATQSTEDRKNAVSKENNVQLMTIHQAKGLEFPIVLVLGTAVPKTSNRKMDQAEEKRLAYIALTRAKCYTYLSIAPHNDIYSHMFTSFSNNIQMCEEYDQRNVVGKGYAMVSSPQSSSRESSFAPVTDSQIDQLNQNHWARYSYSSLKAQQQIMQPQSWVKSNEDESNDLSLSPSADDIDLQQADGGQPTLDLSIWNFPKGRHVGTMLHNIMEWVIEELQMYRVNNTENSMPDDSLTKKLSSKIAESLRIMNIEQHWVDCLLATILSTIHQKLGDNKKVSIYSSDSNQISVEANFTLSLDLSWRDQVAKLLQLSVDEMKNFADNAHLTGFIDLMIGDYATGEFYIYDFKSDWLGNSSADYSAQKLTEIVSQRGYSVQTLLYSAALARLLKAQGITDATIHYGVIFMRGLADNPDDLSNGIWQRKVDQAALLDIL